MPQNDPSPMQLSGLIEAIYATVTDPSLWPAVLEQISEVVSGAQTLLFLNQPGGSSSALRCSRTPDDLLYPFLEHYSSVNVLSAPCDRMFMDGTARFSHLALPDDAFERSEFYQDFFRKHDLYYSMGVKHHSPTGALEYLSIQRSRRSTPFSESEGRLLALLMPHIRQAVSLQKAFGAKLEQAKAANSALASFGSAVVTIDEGGAITYMSPAAEAIFREGLVLRVKNRKLYARERDANERLQARLRSVLSLDRSFVVSRQEALLLRSPGAEQEWHLLIKPHRTSAGSHATTRGALLSIHRVGERPRPRGALLGSLYDLSATECRVADLLLSGSDPKAVGAALHLTLETTRYYVKRILQKTGTHRQSDLIRLMLSLPGDGLE